MGISTTQSIIYFVRVRYNYGDKVAINRYNSYTPHGPRAFLNFLLYLKHRAGLAMPQMQVSA